MRRYLKVLTVLALIIAVPAAGLVFMLRREACVRYERILAQDDRGREIVDTYESCQIIVNEAYEWIDLVSPGGRHEHIFEFEPAGGAFCGTARFPFEPVAQWIAGGVLRISLGTVGSIDTQRTDVDGVHVIYDIGQDLR